jgi:hypothetical protein
MTLWRCPTRSRSDCASIRLAAVDLPSPSSGPSECR